MVTTPNMLLILPDLGADIGTWDDKLNTLLPLVDLHDHSTGKGVKVTPTGLNINADLSLIGTSAITNAKALQFTAAAAYTVARSLFVLSSDNELYWRTNGGTNVKITSGNALNMSLVGGIYGDYSTTSAKVYYEDAGKRYKMLQSGPAPDFWAAVDVGDLKLYEKASGISNAVTLKSPAALAASYSLTMPAALPAATALLQVSSAGVISTNVTGTRSPGFFTTLEASGVVALGTLVAAFTATGAITATDFKHTTVRRQIIPASAMVPIGATAAFTALGRQVDLGTHTGGTDTPTVVCPVILDAGSRITSIRILLINNSAGTPTGRFKSWAGSGGSTSIANAVSAASEVNLAGLTTTIATSVTYWVQVEGVGLATDSVWSCEITYDRP